jgi:hypothetical protein
LIHLEGEGGGMVREEGGGRREEGGEGIGLMWGFSFCAFSIPLDGEGGEESGMREGEERRGKEREGGKKRSYLDL